MKNIAKILCFVLSLVLIISVMGVSAFADESETYVAYTVDSNFENRVDYQTLGEAIKNVPNGGFIYLVADVTESIESFTGVSIFVDTEVVESATINNTCADRPVDFDNVSIGYGVTLNVKTLYTGGSTNSIDGTVNVEGDYVHGYNANTMVSGTLKVGGELSIIENTYMYNGISIYGTVTAETVTITSGALSGYWATLTCDNFVADVESGIFFDFGESTITATNATVNANLDFKAVDNGDGTYSLVAKQYVAEVDGKKYEDFNAALKAIQADSVLYLLSDVTFEGTWDSRSNGAKITVPVTIEGNYCTLKIVGTVKDNNWNTVFRFEGANAVVNNLTIDVSEATGVQRGISTKYSVEAYGCTFIGNDSAKRAIIYGEGAGTAINTVTATIDGCNFINWSYGVSDNQSGKDSKSVSITNSTFNDASVLVSASETAVFTGNTISAGYLNITSYSATNVLDVTVEGNTFDPEWNSIVGGATGSVQAGVAIRNPGEPFIGTDGYWYVSGINTGYKAVPEITVVDGYWVINGLPTEYRAEAIDGVPSTVEIRDFNGAGYWFINGKNTKIRAEAIDGVGIAKIEKSETLSSTNVSAFVITFTDGTTFTITVNNGLDGNQGAVGPEGPMGKPGEVGAQGAPGVDGEDNSEVIQIAIIASAVCVALALIVLLARAFKKDRFALPF